MISPLLLRVIYGVTAVSVLLLLTVLWHHANATTTDIHWKDPHLLAGEKRPEAKPTPPMTVAQEAVHYIMPSEPVATPSPCRICEERRERYRSAVINPEIVSKPNTLELQTHGTTP